MTDVMTDQKPDRRRPAWADRFCGGWSTAEVKRAVAKFNRFLQVLKNEVKLLNL